MRAVPCKDRSFVLFFTCRRLFSERGARPAFPRRRMSGARRVAAGAEILEARILPAVALLIDYSLDNGFFSSAERRTAMEAVARELGSRLNDALPYVPTGAYSVTDPSTFTSTTRTFDVPANAVRVFVSGTPLAGYTVGLGGWRTNTGLRDFDRTHDFQPYVGYIGFDNDGSTGWNFSDTGSGTQTNFQAVARHELLHVLGMGGAASWDARVSGGFFTGAATRAANGGVAPGVDSSGGHFVQGTNSIMGPVISSIIRPTAVDWAALDDIGWDVSAPATPGLYADVVGRTLNGTWWISSNGGASGLSSPTTAGHWNTSAGWRDVQFGDFDGNGLKDLVGRTSGGAWWVGFNGGGAFQNRYMGFWSERVGWQDVGVGDFNGDGRADVVGRTASGAWYVAQSVGTTFVTTRWAGWSPLAGWHDVQIGDFDGDGRDDIAARNKFGAWWVGRSTGGSFTTTFWAGWNEAAGWRDVLVADFDGNGRDDIAARSRFGEWYVGLSVGARFSTARWANWNEAAGWRDVAVGDFYGDARPDIIGRTSTGGWYVAANLAASFNTLPTPFGSWVELSGWRDVQVGQFAGSAKADILARTATGAWYVGENSGSGITFRPFGQWNEGLVWQNVASGRNLVVPVAGAAAFAETDAVPTADGRSAAMIATHTHTDSSEAQPLTSFAAPQHAPPVIRTEARTVTSAEEGRKPLSTAPQTPVFRSGERLLDDIFADDRLLSALAR